MNTKCNNCGGSDFSFFLKVKCHWSKTILNVVSCNNCNLVFLNPRPDKNLGIDYFDRAYSKSKGFESHSYYRDDELIFKRNKNRFKIIENIETPNHKILDFGAGQGHFVRVCKENEWAAIGIEQSSAAISSAKEHLGIVLHHSLDTVKENNFGIITLWDVIEHLDNPKDVLMTLSKYLHHDGFFIIETSNINSYDFYINKSKWSYWHIDHYYYYSNLTLEYLLNSIDFEIFYPGSGETKQKTQKIFNLEKYINPKNYHLALKSVYYKLTKTNVSNNSLMTMIAKRK